MRTRIGKALLATLHDLKQKQEEEQRKAGIIDEDAETRYYTNTLISIMAPHTMDS